MVTCLSVTVPAAALVPSRRKSVVTQHLERHFGTYRTESTGDGSYVLPLKPDDIGVGDFAHAA